MAVMAPDMNFSATSLESLADDGSLDLDDYSSISDEDVYIGISSRPQLPFILSNNLVSKNLPSRLAGSILTRGPIPSPQSQSANSHPPCDGKNASNYLPAPRPSKPPPLFPPHVSSPLARSSLNAVAWSPDSHDRQGRNLAKTQYGYRERTHSDNSVHHFSHARENGYSIVKEEIPGIHVAERPVESQTSRRSLLPNLEDVQSQRSHLHRLRLSKASTDREFMEVAQQLLAHVAQLHHLHKLFEAMQNSHKMYEEAERRLESAIDELLHGPEESGLRGDTTEDLGQGHFNSDNYRDSYSNKSEDWALRGITGDRPEATHPLYDKLRTAFGELQLARELLANTRMKRQVLRARKSQPLMEGSLGLLESYGDVGKKKAFQLQNMALMTEDDIKQLQEYDGLEEGAEQDIKLYTEQVRILQQQCREKGAIPSSSCFHQDSFGPDSFYGEEIPLEPGPFSIDDESATLAHPVFPLLLSNPTHLLHGPPCTARQFLKMVIPLPPDAPFKAKRVEEAAREANIHSLLSATDSNNKSEYIDRWLLHKLHHSAMEAELLWSTFRSRLKILDIDRWQRDVLRFWWHDGPLEPESMGTKNNGTDKAPTFVSSGAGFNELSYSDSGQLDGIRNWKLDDSWP